MQFRVLGPVDVVGRQSTGLGRGRRRTILAILLAAGGDLVTTDGLIAALWSDDPPASARKSLQSHVSRLRAQLQAAAGGETAPLVSEPDGYRLDLDGHEFDAARFEAAAARGRQLLDRSPSRAAELLGEALAAWRGPAYGDLADHAGVRAEAVRLEQARAAAMGDRIDALLATGQYDQALGEVASAVAADPLRERFHAQRMLALYRAGRQAEALAAHRDLRDRLREELGVDPSPAVRELHERILRQDPQLQGEAVPPAASPAPGHEPAGTRPAATHGPAPVAPGLVGRDREVVEVAERIVPGALLTLTGPGGVGKTRLAEQVAVQVADRFDDGTATVALATVRDAGSVGAALVTALGIQPTGDRTPVESLVAALADRRMLLVLDNCEHVLEVVAPLVDQVGRQCREVAVLATSRERLHLPGERLWPVAPLDVPAAAADPSAVSATAAGTLFRVRAEAADPGFALTDANAAAVAELCRRLDGMPLAIELAAARARAMTPADLVERLDQRFSLLAGGPRHEAGRHRTLQSVVAWSYDLLGPVEARLFDRLSVFAGAFTLDAAERVCAGGDVAESEVAGLVGELVDKSMVVVERHGSALRYRLLDTLREFGARRLADVDDPDRWRRAHADHHVALAERLGPRVRGPDEPEAVAGIDAAFADLRAAHAWLVEAGDVNGALRIPAALGDHLFYRLRDEVTTWARRAVALPGAVDHPARAAALTTAALGATSRAECGRACEEAAEALAHAGPDDMATVWALAALATAALYEGRLDDQRAHAEELAAVADRMDVPFHVAFAGVHRVLSHAYQGRSVAALAVLDELDAAAARSGSPTMHAFACYSRGETLLETRPAEAAEALEEAVRTARRVDNALVDGVAMVSLASSRGRLGQTDRALRQFRDIVAHWRRLGDHTHQLTTVRNLVVLLASTQADEAAAVLHGAVTAAATPSFGVEAERLADAWAQVEARLGPAAVDAAARGRRVDPSQLGQLALGYLDELLEPTTATADVQPTHNRTP